MDKSSEKQGATTTTRDSSGEGSLNEQLQRLIDLLRGEVEHLRNDRDSLKERVVELERRQEEEREQWKEEREQWKTQIDKLEKKVKDLAIELKKSQGLEPKSEKGSRLAGGKNSSGGGSDDGNGPTDPSSPGDTPKKDSAIHEKKYLAIFARQRPNKGIAAGFESRQEFWQKVGSEPHLIPAPAKIFHTKVFGEREEVREFSFTNEEKQALFGHSAGLHSKMTPSTVYGLDLAIVKTTCFQETLRSHKTGVSYSKSKSLGPSGSQMSWEALSTIAVLVAEYAMPIERLAKVFGGGYFSSDRISRWFVRSASPQLPIYIAMGRKLAYARYLKVDDTSGLVLDMRKEAVMGLTADKDMTGEEWENYLNTIAEKLTRKGGVDLVTPVISVFGRVAQRSCGTGAKTSLNVTLVSGKLDTADYSSTVYFYRTHFGQAGNLLTRILEQRPAHSAEEVIHIQGDCSPQNNLEAEVAGRFNVIKVGCTSHSRRPFYRYRLRDREAAFCLLRCFAILARVEDMISRGPLTEERILKLRKRYSRKVWAIILSICQAVLKGKRHDLARNQIWKNADKIYNGCAYIKRNRKALTFYLSHPEIDPANDSSEQGLRGEKLIEAASHFRKSENGRVALDIHRSMIASCSACGLDYKVYLKTVFEADPNEIKKNPEQYFPHAIANTLRCRGSPEEKTEARPQFYH